MSNQNNPQAQASQKFRLNGLYVKDISFENPHAPAIFMQAAQNQSKMGVNIDVSIKHLEETSYEVALRVTTKAEENGKTIFLVEVLHGGIFTINPALPQESHHRILLVDCAATIYPFARRIISDLTTEGGFPPVLLEPINFEAMYFAKTGLAA